MRHSIKDITKTVNNLLKESGLLTPPVSVRKVAIFLGIEVIYKDFSDEISGALTFKEQKPYILCNVNHSPYRKRFTIAHEIGHYILKHGREGLFIDKKQHFIFRNEATSTGEQRQEIEANAFAAALLMPEPLVKKELENLILDGFDLYDEREDELPIIKKLAKKFEVSKAAMTFRIANLRLINI